MCVLKSKSDHFLTTGGKAVCQWGAKCGNQALIQQSCTNTSQITIQYMIVSLLKMKKEKKRGSIEK